MMGGRKGGRLSILAAALIVARRDFVAVLWSRSFVAFLAGPLFMLVVVSLASGLGRKVEQNAAQPVLGVAMSAPDAAALVSARNRLNEALDDSLPVLAVLDPPAATADPARVLSDNRALANAIVTGSPAKPVLTGPPELVDDWRGPLALMAAEAAGEAPRQFPHVAVHRTGVVGAPDDRIGRMRTAQAGQTVMFLLTMLLAGMVLSNLVEEKANKIIEVLAAAIPMDAVFLGKLFAMLAVSFVGICVWGTTIGSILLAGGRSLSELTAPAVGWPAFLTLGVVYFAMAYLLLGSVFLTIGSMASTVREVQTLSMPVTMLQLVVFFFASYAMASPHAPIEQAASLVPFSSPYAMLARAAQEPGLGQHLVALGYQAAWVALFVRVGSRLFRCKVMKSGPAPVRGKAKTRTA
ncbi:ABC transporter permease [Novosphingobium flavum]|uniref:ABC transporter permease n=1 Tax=Novosphingobium flavum TaxID=1778672 RepID=A0A7X1FPU5_9SPHN|nr:ABC transporter permease [Novosphingobium flavum]MBC2664644.1 ABC transporter permease [Novosphingobium flavum]